MQRQRGIFWFGRPRNCAKSGFYTVQEVDMGPPFSFQKGDFNRTVNKFGFKSGRFKTSSNAFSSESFSLNALSH